MGGVMGKGAVEMTERWKPWKAKDRLSTVPTAPWKSRAPREISTFPQLGRTADGKSGKPKAGFPLFHARPATTIPVFVSQNQTKTRRSGPAASRRSRAKKQQISPPSGRQKGRQWFPPVSGSLFD